MISELINANMEPMCGLAPWLAYHVGVDFIGPWPEGERDEKKRSIRAVLGVGTVVAFGHACFAADRLRGGRLHD